MIVTSQKFSWSVSTRQNSPQERILVDCLLRQSSPWLSQVRNSHGVYLPGRIHPKRGFSWTVCLGNPHHDCDKSEILMECIYQAEFTPREDSRGLSARHYSPWLWQVRKSHGVYLPGRIHPKRGFSWTVSPRHNLPSLWQDRTLPRCVYQTKLTWLWQYWTLTEYAYHTKLTLWQYITFSEYAYHTKLTLWQYITLSDYAYLTELTLRRDRTHTDSN